MLFSRFQLFCERESKQMSIAATSRFTRPRARGGNSLKTNHWSEKLCPSLAWSFNGVGTRPGIGFLTTFGKNHPNHANTNRRRSRCRSGNIRSHFQHACTDMQATQKILSEQSIPASVAYMLSKVAPFQTGASINFENNWVCASHYHYRHMGCDLHRHG